MTRLRSLRAEIWIVLGLTLGQSAVYALLSLAIKMSGAGLRDSTATLNASRADSAWLDLTLQVLGIGFALVPVALALYLLNRPIGLDRSRPVHDLGVGVVLAAVVGLPGLGLYAAGRALGITAEIVPSALADHWWIIPVLLLSALQNALLEEVVGVGYLLTRLRQLAWGPWAAIAASAALRGGYHAYQGIGPILGNFAMGLLFGWWFTRTRRVMPLVVAHTLIDAVAFVGYALLF